MGPEMETVDVRQSYWQTMVQDQAKLFCNGTCSPCHSLYSRYYLVILCGFMCSLFIKKNRQFHDMMSILADNAHWFIASNQQVLIIWLNTLRPTTTDICMSSTWWIGPGCYWKLSPRLIQRLYSISRYYIDIVPPKSKEKTMLSKYV